MEFCESCGSIMVPIKTKDGKGNYLLCRKCGKKKYKSVKNFKIKEEGNEKKDIVVVDKEINALPTTTKLCPKCENGQAYWWLIQTRSADEPPTQFFKCTKCNHTWREYK
jgi:DNA-directed RNA polymerase subunit M